MLSRKDMQNFSSRGPLRPRDDPNQIFDEGATNNTGGIIEASRICDALGAIFEVALKWDVYIHGWGQGCADSKMIPESWG